MGRKRGNGRLINLESAVSTSETCEIWHSTRGARNPVRSRRRTLQNVHTHVKLCPPPGRKRVVSYHHSQGTTKLQGQGPGTGGETAVRACSVGTAAFAYCPPAVGADKQHHASRVLKIEGIKKRPGAGTSSGPLCVSKSGSATFSRRISWRKELDFLRNSRPFRHEKCHFRGTPPRGPSLAPSGQFTLCPRK